LTAFDGVKPDFKFEFSAPDKQAMDFFARLDTFYFSKFVSNHQFGGQIRGFINGFLERNEAIFDGWTDDAEKEFNRLFGAAIQSDTRANARRIINNSVGRIRNYAHVEQLNDVGFEYMEIVAILDGATCSSGVCEAMNGTRIPVGPARDAIQEFVKIKSEKAILPIKSFFKTNPETFSRFSNIKMFVVSFPSKVS